MNCKLVKCGICFAWYSPRFRTHCYNCGAYHFHTPNFPKNLCTNAMGIEMARGVPIELDQIITRVVKLAK